MLKGCGGFPLALEVIGGSLCGWHVDVQRSRVKKWSSDHFIYDPNNSCSSPMQPRIFRWWEHLERLFHGFRCISWRPKDPYAFNELNEDGVDAIANLHELTTWNLAGLVMTKYVDFLFLESEFFIFVVWFFT